PIARGDGPTHRGRRAGRAHGSSGGDSRTHGPPVAAGGQDASDGSGSPPPSPCGPRANTKTPRGKRGALSPDYVPTPEARPRGRRDPKRGRDSFANGSLHRAHETIRSVLEER